MTEHCYLVFKIKRKKKRDLLELLLNLFSRKLTFSTGILNSKQSFPGLAPTQLVVLGHGHFILNYLKGQFASSSQISIYIFQFACSELYQVTLLTYLPPNSNHITALTFLLLRVFTTTNPTAAA